MLDIKNQNTSLDISPDLDTSLKSYTFPSRASLKFPELNSDCKTLKSLNLSPQEIMETAKLAERYRGNCGVHKVPIIQSNKTISGTIRIKLQSKDGSELIGISIFDKNKSIGIFNNPNTGKYGISIINLENRGRINTVNQRKLRDSIKTNLTLLA